jgi:hypothetical protein
VSWLDKPYQGSQGAREFRLCGARMAGATREPAAARRLAALQLPSTEKLPVIVWLTHDGGDLLRCVVPLDGRTEETAYASIKKALTLAGDAMENVAQAASAKTDKKGVT